MELKYNGFRISITSTFIRIFSNDSSGRVCIGEVMKDTSTIRWSSKLDNFVPDDVYTYCEKIIKNKAFL